jgi:GNAT superfamily N-acetyltransferase
MSDSSPCQVDEPFRVRNLRREEVGLYRQWADGEGWNPGRHDAACFFDADPDGFFVGELAGEPVACISCVRYSPDFGFLGQYIVKPEYRGKGFGVRVWSAGMAHLAGCNVGLDGVLAQVPNYEKSSFHTSHLHVRYGGTIVGKMHPAINRLDSVAFDEVAAYDRTCFPAARETFLRSWIAQPESVALAYMEEGIIGGFACARRASEGFKIGPLFADDRAAAEALLLALAKETGGQLVIDVPETSFHSAAESMALAHGLTGIFQCARMYTRGRPAVETSKVFGITSLELG